jgi:glutamate dehydrogenase/leucine dehydrogenase
VAHKIGETLEREDIGGPGPFKEKIDLYALRN